MRDDISADIIEKTSNTIQSIDSGSNPMISLIIARKQTVIDDMSFAEKRKVGHTDSNLLSDVSIAVSHPVAKGENLSVWVAYIRDGALRVRMSEDTANLSETEWNNIPVGQPTAEKCDIAFKSNRIGDEWVTARLPFVFYLSGGVVKYIKVKDSGYNEYTAVNGDVDDISVRQSPEGLMLTFLRNGYIYYKIFKNTNNTWGAEHSLGLAPTGTTEISTFNTLDGFGLMAYDGTSLYQRVGVYNDSYTWGNWTEEFEADGLGIIAEYYDGKKEALYNNGTFKYRTADLSWSYDEEEDLQNYTYAVLESDHTNQGTLYMAALMHGNSEDVIYCFKYTYMRDVSVYVQTANQRLQNDNPISQTNATMLNVRESLYTSDATLFAPSSMMLLGVRYGSSDRVPMFAGYLDEVSFNHGDSVVSISARNKTGVYLADQTFDEDIAYADVPSIIIIDIFERFGIDDYELDESCDYLDGGTRIITLNVEATTTGLKALQTINGLLSNGISVGQQWKFEERYDGKIVVGYDAFRAQFIPKNNYIFNGKNDVFASSVNRCSDGAYTSVRCTGITPEGKAIEYTYPVKNFRFWNVGGHKTYHAKEIEGISKSQLKAFAKALAKNLKYVGRVINNTTNLKPQLLIGDVANITYDEDENESRRIGTITEITHTLGINGYFTSFVTTSGGDVNQVSAGIYSSESTAGGNNRNKRISDYIAGSRESDTSGNGYAAIIDTEALNFVETIRNTGMRLLDEPLNVQVEYVDTVPVVNLKWEDPPDIDTDEPEACTWLGTIVVRSEAGIPRNPFDNCITLVNSTVRDAFKSTSLLDNTVEYNHKYYYGIFPYHMSEIDHKYHYRFTKVILIECTPPVDIPEITSLSCNIVTVTVVYDISDSYTWDYVTLVFKKGSTPESKTDGTAVDISGTRSTVISDLDEDSDYFFKIYSQEHSSGKEFESDVESITTREKEYTEYDYTGDIQTFTAPKTGIYQLETWGAQGGDAEDSENNLVARGGYGAYAVGEVSLTQGDTLYIGVGGQNGYNGGGLKIWDGSEIAIIWSGENNKLTAQISNNSILFKMYSGNTVIYSFTSQTGTSVSDISKINAGFLIDTEQEVAKPSFIYDIGSSSYKYNSETPTDAEMADIYTWLSAGLPSS